MASLEALLDEQPALVTARIRDALGVQRSLVHLAADWPGHFPEGSSVVELLAGRGADLDAAVLNGNGDETALHWAASSDDLAVLDALLDHGANIEADGAVFTGGTAMSDAVIFAKWRAAHRLFERGATVTIWQAAALGLLERVRDQVADATEDTASLTNALWHACRAGQLEVARYLVEVGADSSWRGHDGKTPLDVARESQNGELEAWLVDISASETDKERD